MPETPIAAQEPTPGMQTSEMKVVAAAAALTTLAGIFHKQLDMGTATAWVNGIAGLYVLARSGVKMAHSLAAGMGAWAASQKTPQTRTIVMPAVPGMVPQTPPPASAPGTI